MTYNLSQQHAESEFKDLKRLQNCLDHLLLSCKNLHEEISVIRQDFQKMLTDPDIVHSSSDK